MRKLTKIVISWIVRCLCRQNENRSFAQYKWKLRIMTVILIFSKIRV